MFSSTAKNIEMFFEKKIESCIFLLVSYGRSNLITVEVPVPSSSASEEATSTGTYRYYGTWYGTTGTMVLKQFYNKLSNYLFIYMTISHLRVYYLRLSVASALEHMT